MCKWYCTSDGPNSDLKCIHCGKGYCGVCLTGDGGRMKGPLECASCGKKPGTESIARRASWKDGQSLEESDVSGMGLRERSKSRTEGGSKSRSKSSGPPSKKAASSIFDRLTDPNLYTGTHKTRFDKDGKGLGLKGRDSISKGVGHVPATVMLSRPVRNSSLTETKGERVRTPETKKRTGPTTQDISSSHDSLTNITNEISGSASPPRSDSNPSSPSSEKDSKKKSIFDKLTDHTLYTGTHKNRFDSQGKGRGAVGRQDSGGRVDLSKITTRK